MVVASVPNVPLLHSLESAAQDDGIAAFHFPGHTRGRAAPPSMANLLGHGVFAHDLPELPGLDNLHCPKNAIAQAQSLAASLFGADSTWFLVNGSTCGIQAAVMATCSPGDYLILPRNCHISAVSAMVLSGAIPVYLHPIYDEIWGIAHGVTASAVEDAIMDIRKHKSSKIGAVLVVSPTYFGVCSRLDEIALVCKRHGVPLIVDEAHGGHFHFHAELPKTALEQGADIAVQSTHKVMSSLTQSAMLHLKGCNVASEKIAKCLRALQTSSPSYLLLGSLDAARDQMSNLHIFDDALHFANMARHSLKLVPGIGVLGGSSLHALKIKNQGSISLDPLRLTVGVWELGMTGFEADDILCTEYKVVAELPSSYSLTFAIGIGTRLDDIKLLVEGFRGISIQSKERAREGITHPWIPTSNIPNIMLSPRDAFFADVEIMRLENSVGYVCAELICPYPPGIPVIFPGEVITRELLDHLEVLVAKGAFVSGASDPSLSTLLVCKL